MKNRIIIAILITAISLIFAGCGMQENNLKSALSTSTNVVSTEENTTKAVDTTEKETTISEAATQKNEVSDATTARPAEQKSAGQSTTKKQSETTAKRDKSQTTVLKKSETTKAAVTTTKPTTTKTITTTEKSFDVDYWVTYAKNYAKSVGLNLNSDAVDCWDNPINANSNCKYLERDIKDRLNRYAKNDDMTDVWIWAEQTGSNSYQIYIGYA